MKGLMTCWMAGAAGAAASSAGRRGDAPAAGAAPLTPAVDAAPPAAPAIQQVIRPYMGKEQLFVQVSLNLIHFNQSKAQEPSED